MRGFPSLNARLGTEVGFTLPRHDILKLQKVYPVQGAECCTCIVSIICSSCVQRVRSPFQLSTHLDITREDPTTERPERSYE